jgi:phosphogluconate dehydratase
LSAIHVCPEAVDGGAIAKLRDGDILRVDAAKGRLDIMTEGVLERDCVTADLTANGFGQGRELFNHFRTLVGSADTGASSI